MQIRYFLIYVLFTSIIIFHSCDVNDSMDNDYSRSIENNGVTIFIKDGTIDAPGEIKIVNNSIQKVYVPFILYPYCNFSLYSLQKKNNSEWERLSYDEFQNKWLKKSNQDSVIAICDEYRSPVVINSRQSFKQSISNVEEVVDYQLKIYFRYSEIYNTNNPDKEIVINYFVK